MPAKKKRPPTAKETRAAIARAECVECGGKLKVVAEDAANDEKGLECEKCLRRYLAAGTGSPSYHD